MRILLSAMLIAIGLAAAGCNRAEDAMPASALRRMEAESAADAAEAAADAAMAAADASSEIVVGPPPATGAGDKGAPGRTSNLQADAVADKAMLAYEHSVSIRMDVERMPAMVSSLRKACDTGRHGSCLLLGVEQSGGEFAYATLRMRLEPRAVEPMIAAAGEGGEIGDRSTRAEDLAVVVRDNTVLQDRLRKQQARLLEFQERDDLKVADVIALAEQLSRIEAELEAAERDGATHKRRIETQLLTIELRPTGGDAGRNSIAIALRDTGSTMAASTAVVIRVVAGLLPVLLVLSLIGWGIRRLWRWSRRRKGE